MKASCLYPTVVWSRFAAMSSKRSEQLQGILNFYEKPSRRKCAPLTFFPPFPPGQLGLISRASFHHHRSTKIDGAAQTAAGGGTDLVGASPNGRPQDQRPAAQQRPWGWAVSCCRLLPIVFICLHGVAAPNISPQVRHAILPACRIGCWPRRRYHQAAYEGSAIAIC